MGSSKYIQYRMVNPTWMCLDFEYNHRYGKLHGCHKALFEAKKTFHKLAGEVITCYCMVEGHLLVRCLMSLNMTQALTLFTAYKNYIRSKPWVASNYLRDPSENPIGYENN